MPVHGDLIGGLATEIDIARRRRDIATWADAPIVVYGVGTYSHEVRAFLAKDGIDVDALVVDREYVADSPDGNTELFASDQIPDHLRNARVVVAFTSDPDEATALAQGFGSGPVELLDCRRWASFDPWRADVGALAARLQPLYDHLADEASRRVLIAYLNAKLLLHPGPLRDVRTGSQYFPAGLAGFMPSADDVYIDGGAYTGDTLQAFADLIPEGCEAYIAFEPEMANRSALESRLLNREWTWVRVIPKGLWSTTTSMPFNGSGGSAARIDFESQQGRIEVVRLDDFDLPVTSIKLDIEGAEAEALKGSASTITRHAPRLAIAAYHRSEDLTVLPELISTIRDDYRFYLRFHGVYSEELVLYAATGRG